jgi:hypothetical protein
VALSNLTKSSAGAVDGLTNSSPDSAATAKCLQAKKRTPLTHPARKE